MSTLKKGKIEKYMDEIMDSGKGVFMSLIDPGKTSPEENVKLAKLMEEGGADIIMLGGSTGVQGSPLDITAKMIKENISVPLHLFPGNVGNVTQYADSIYFMSLMNSQNPYWITGAQALAAPLIKNFGLEAMPTAYLVFEPGETVGWVGDVKPLPRHKPELATAYAMAAQYMGMRYVILESGSGAPAPVTNEIVKAVSKSTDLRIVIAGGVKTPEQAKKAIQSGGNAVHIGTKIEESSNPLEKIKKFAKAIHLKL